MTNPQKVSLPDGFGGKDRTGVRHEKLVAVRPDRISHGQWLWQWKCDCGNTVVRIPGTAERTGHCGCQTSVNIKKHGMCGTKTYNSWIAMIGRCCQPSSEHYSRYGGRGITVCERWMKFAEFFEDMGVRPDGTTLDRIDNDGNYEPGNCRWSTRKKQMSNTSNNTRIAVAEETHTLIEWSRISGVESSVILSRIASGWPTWDAVFKQPDKKIGRRLSAAARKEVLQFVKDGVSKTEIMRRFGISRGTISNVVNAESKGKIILARELKT